MRFFLAFALLACVFSAAFAGGKFRRFGGFRRRPVFFGPQIIHRPVPVHVPHVVPNVVPVPHPVYIPFPINYGSSSSGSGDDLTIISAKRK